MGNKRKRQKTHAAKKHAIGCSPASASQNSSISLSDNRPEAAFHRLRPWLLAATVALFVVAPLLPSESNGRGGEMLPLVMLTIVLAAVWAVSQFGRPRFRVKIQATDIAVFVLVGLHTIAALLAARHGHARPAINMLWTWIGLGLGYFLLRQLTATAREARAVVVVMIAMAVVLSGFGLWQYAYEFPALRAEYAKNPDKMLQSHDMWFPPGSPERAQFDNRLASREPLATFALTNSLAGYLAPWLVFTVGIAFSAGRSRRKILIATSAAALITVACLLLTKSRSAYAATAIGLILVAFYLTGYRARATWKWILFIVLIVAVLVGLAAAVGGLDVEVFSEAKKSLGYRTQYWHSSLKMIADRPIFGCGPGQFQNAYTAYKLPEASEEIADPHNFLIEVWATAGTPSALALLAVLACFAWSVISRKNQPATEKTDPQSQPADASIWVLGGGLFGLLAAWPLGLMVAFPPDMAVFWLGAPLGVLAAFFLYDWIADFEKPLYPLAAIAVVVLLINLTAAGGIGFYGVAGSFWLLIAVALFSDSDSDLRRLKPHLAPTLGALLAILAAICYFTAYRPVLNAKSHEYSALDNPPRAGQLLLQSALADPLSAQPWRQLSELSFEAWKQTKNQTYLNHFEQYMATALQLDAASSSTWRTSGRRYLEAYDTTKNKANLDHALASYHKAVELYPNDATTRAEYALALRLAGRPKEAEKQAQTAIRLDEITPHTDRKIPKPLRDRLIDTPE